MTLEELKATQEERDLLQLWELWQDRLLATGDRARTARDKQLIVAHYEELGTPIGSPEAPIALMWLGFLGGVQSALEVIALGEAGEGAEHEAL